MTLHELIVHTFFTCKKKKKKITLSLCRKLCIQLKYVMQEIKKTPQLKTETDLFYSYKEFALVIGRG